MRKKGVGKKRIEAMEESYKDTKMFFRKANEIWKRDQRQMRTKEKAGSSRKKTPPTHFRTEEKLLDRRLRNKIK